MKRSLLLWSMLLILSSCMKTSIISKDQIVELPLLQKIAVRFAREATCKHSLFFVDSSALYHDGLQSICFRFTTQAHLDVCSARDLIVEITEGLLAYIHEEPSLATGLSHHPFPVESLQIFIECESFGGVYIDPFYIGRIVLQGGFVTYYSHVAIDPMQYEWEQRSESYSNAKRFTEYQKYFPSCIYEDEVDTNPLKEILSSKTTNNSATPQHVSNDLDSDLLKEDSEFLDSNSNFEDIDGLENLFDMDDEM